MICIVSHDAGGAEVLASYVAKYNLECLYVLAGPAVSIFERRFGNLALSSLEEAVSECEWLLCGTSWQSDLEWKAIGVARREGKRTIAFLDHWGHYRERFVRQGVEQLPDEIWVGDSLAENHALKCFPNLPVSLVPNPYFDDIKREIAAFSKSTKSASSHGNGLNVLFVCEPLSEHGLKEFGNERHWGYTEFDALHYFFSNQHIVGKKINSIVIRPHPSERAGKYSAIVSEFGEIACMGGRKSLLEEIAASDVVVGCESMAMVVGLLAGRRVISCIPIGGKPCVLPQPEIESMQDLLK